MSTTPSQYASFLVRLGREGNAETHDAVSIWHGEVEHIQSGEHQIFGTVDELLSHLRQQTNDMVGAIINEQSKIKAMEALK